MTATPIRGDIIAATNNPTLFRPWFKDRKTWAAWFAFLRALFGLPMSADDLAIFKRCTGRDGPPPSGCSEAWLCVGRRGGKSLILALAAVYLATAKDWRPFLQPGERATIMIIAADRRQSRVIFRYIASMLKDVKVLARMVERETADTLELTNQVSIEIQTASFKTTRGYSLAAILCDEIAYWQSDETGANPDVEILAAVRPAMSTMRGNAMLLCASSPYARKGALWDVYSKHYGQPGIIRRALGAKASSTLVWNADTATMNPTVPAELIAEAFDDDPARAIAEYGRDGRVEFRSDVESFISKEVLDACTIPDRHELPPVQGIKFLAFTDPSGGSGADSMTLAISHMTTGKAVLDLVREVRPPFSPESVTAEFSAVLQSYGITKITGDRFAGEWPRERFRVHGISYEVSDRTKSEIYQAVLPILNSGNAELLELPRMHSQFLGLERRTARGGRDSIDHAPGGHDDIANAAAAALVLAYVRSARRGALAAGVPTFGSSKDTGGGLVSDGKYTVSKRPHISASSPGYAPEETGRDEVPNTGSSMGLGYDPIRGWHKPDIDPRSR